MRGIEGGSEKVSRDVAYEKALRVLSEDSIDMERFRDIDDPRYGRQVVDRDIAEVARLEKIFEHEATPESRELKRIATIFEAIIHEHVELSDWLGPEAYTLKASKYDDIKNGIDSIVEFPMAQKETSHLALAIDVTFNPQVEKKLRRIKDEIKSGKLAEIKYFDHDDPDKYKIDDVPRVVVGADRKAVGELIEVWLSGDNKKLAVHPIQHLILEEIRMELEAFEKYAITEGQKKPAEVYRKTLVLLDTITKAKKAHKTPDIYSDSVLHGISRYLKNFS